MLVNGNVAGYNGKNVITTNNGKKYEKPSAGTTAGAIFAGNMTAGSILMLNQKLTDKLTKSMFKENKLLDTEVFRNAVDVAYNKSGLAQKGIKFIDVNAENRELISNLAKKLVPKWSQKIPVLNEFYVYRKQGNLDLVYKGENAFFLPKHNLIVWNKAKIPQLGLHEMGHALNYNMGGVGKLFAKAKGPARILASLALISALFKRKKADGEEPKGVFDKVTTFIKDNCGKIVCLGWLPFLLEEGLASIKGAKLAKGLVSAEQLKALNKFNGKALLTYVTAAIASGLAVCAAGKVRDAIAAPKEIKQ